MTGRRMLWLFRSIINYDDGCFLWLLLLLLHLRLLLLVLGGGRRSCSTDDNAGC